MPTEKVKEFVQSMKNPFLYVVMTGLPARGKSTVIVGHRAVNRMLLSYFVYKRREDVPYIYMPQDSYYHISTSQNRKLFELRKFS